MLNKLLQFLLSSPLILSFLSSLESDYSLTVPELLFSDGLAVVHDAYRGEIVDDRFLPELRLVRDGNRQRGAQTAPLDTGVPPTRHA